MSDFALPPVIRSIALSHPRLSYRHVTSWATVLQRVAREMDTREMLVRQAADAIAHEFAKQVLDGSKIEQREDPEGFAVKVEAYALRYDQLVELLYRAYREGQSEKVGPASLVGTDGKEAAEMRRLQGLLDECSTYLKDGETPAQRMARDHRDSLALMELLAREKRKSEAMLAALKRIKETGVFLGAIAQGMLDDAIRLAEEV